MVPTPRSTLPPLSDGMPSPGPPSPGLGPVMMVPDLAWKNMPTPCGDIGDLLANDDEAPRSSSGGGGGGGGWIKPAGKAAVAGGPLDEEPAPIGQGSRSVFSMSYNMEAIESGNIAVLDASASTGMRQKRSGKGARIVVSFWDEDEGEDGDDDGDEDPRGGNGRNMMEDRSSMSMGERWSLGPRSGRKKQPTKDSRGQTSGNSSPPATSNEGGSGYGAMSVAQSEGTSSIMEGVMGKMQMMDMLNETDGSQRMDDVGSTRANYSSSAGAAQFWKSTFAFDEPALAGHEGTRPCCSMSLVASVAGFAVLLSAAFSTCTLFLLEDLIDRAGLDADQSDTAKAARTKGYLVCAALSLLSILLGCALGLGLTRSLRRIASTLRALCLSGLGEEGDERVDVLAFPSHVKDVQRLQVALVRLQSNISTFACFLPETVVHGILRGDVKAQRLHVEKREVSIMFSDIKEFTNISETLRPKDTLLLLTRYLDVMSRIAQSFDGVVAEILGDGLLVYWNTPDAVPDHSMKAATTALAQLRALTPLNAELDVMKLPRIAIRIGLHTGTVLTGNIGSLTKMKFGCMGDAVNLAARLESLCKMYKVSVVCSGEMHSRLDKDSFFCRKLDVVRVKGKTVPTELYEVIGVVTGTSDLHDSHANEVASGVHSSMAVAVTKAFASSSRVMQTVHGKQWINTVRGAATQMMRNSRTSGMFGSDTCTTSATATATASPSATSSAAGMRTIFGSGSQLVAPEETCSPASRGSARDSRRRGSYTEIMREPLLLSLAETVNSSARRRAGLYEDALRHFLRAEFVQARGILEAMLDEDSGLVDGPADMLLKRTKTYIAEDGVSVANLTPEQLKDWDGIHNLDEK